MRKLANPALLKWMLVAMTVMSSFVVFAQQRAVQPGIAATATATATTDCAATFSSGTGHNATKFCVTVNGNISQFSRDRDEYIQVGSVVEGYGICDVNTNTAYFDYGLNDSGNWGVSSFSATGNQAVSTRKTADGLWEITNTITQIPANGAGSGSAKVSMTITNRTGERRTIVLVRMADVDFLQDGETNFNNDFDHTRDTVTGLEPGGSIGSGLSLTNNTPSDANRPFAQNVPDGPNPCSPLSHFVRTPFVGDGSIVQFTEPTLLKSASKTITMTYQPF